VTNARLLIVEDETLTARILHDSLLQLGYSVLDMAFSGEEAVQRVAETRPDLVLMDIKLQGEMDGVQAAEQIQTRFDIPVIYLTACSDDATLQRAKLTEPFGYILKPLVTKELHTHIEIALYKHVTEKSLRQYRDQLEQRVAERTAELTRSNLQLQQEILERIRAEEEAMDRAENLMAVSELAIQCAAAAPTTDLFELITQNLRYVTGAIAVGLATYNPQAEAFVVRHVSASGSILCHLNELLGHNVIGMYTPVSPDWLRRMLTEVVAVSEDLSEATFGAIPKPIAAAIQKTFGIGSFIGLTLRYGDELMGSIVIAMPWGQPSPPLDVAKTLAYVAAGTLRRTRAEDALRESEGRFRNIFENSPVGIYQTTPDGRILAANPALIRMLGYASFEELAQRDLEKQEYFPEYPRVDFKRRIEGEGRIIGLESVWTRKDGSWLWVRENARVVRDGRDILYYEGTVEDINERKQAEEALKVYHDQLEQLVAARTEELKTANEQLRQEIVEREQVESKLAQQARELARSNAELEQFAYVASHDLREPLRKIKSYTELLERRYAGRLDAKADKYITYIVDGATRMQALITDLLTVSRVGRAEVALEPTDLEAVLNRVLADCEAIIRESGALVTHDSLPVLSANPGQMAELLQNLLQNALKFRGPESPRVHIWAVQGENEWVFGVRDNGIGLDPQHAERIFLIFQRLHTRTEYPGTGIGLAICKKIVENHGGRIWVESQPDQGATFYFTIPVRQSRGFRRSARGEEKRGHATNHSIVD
jgi:PAS domain S-box-containing protein